MFRYTVTTLMYLKAGSVNGTTRYVSPNKSPLIQFNNLTKLMIHGCLYYSVYTLYLIGNLYARLLCYLYNLY